MLDPFPFSAAQVLTHNVQPVADFFSLTTLPLHAHEILLAFTFYHLIFTTISPFLSRRLFPATYSSLNTRTRINWDVHVVSFVQSCIVNGLAFWVIFNDEERAEMNWKGRVWGYTGASGLVQAVATGYFLWDTVITARYLSIFGIGFLAHGVSALVVFALGFRPFVNYYAPIFILYELSSPFLNIHWFCDKLNMTGGTVQLLNGIVLLATFAGARLAFGTYMSIRVFADVFRAWRAGYVTPALAAGGATYQGADGADVPLLEPVSEVMRFAGQRGVPFWLAMSYLGSNLVLNGLNWYWFGKMIETIRKRFDPPFGTKGVGEPLEEKKELEVQRGVYADGHKSVEVSEKSVRNRRRG